MATDPLPLYIKRTSTTGKTPNTTAGSYNANSSYISTGELALNLIDFKMFSSNGSAYFEIGSNLVNLNVNGGMTVGANVTVNTSVLFIGNTIANSSRNSSSESIANSTSTVTTTPMTLSISNSTTKAVIGINSISISNTTANVVLTSVAITVANSTSTFNLTPASSSIGNSTVNTSINATTYSINGVDIIPWINVITDYNVTPQNNAAINTTNFNNIVTAVNSLTNGAIIFFPPGVYPINNPSAITSNNICLLGSGLNTTVIQTAATTGVTFQIDGSQCMLTEMAFVPSVFKTSGYEIQLFGANNCVLRDLYINGGFSGVFLRMCNNTIVDNITVLNATGFYGIELQGNSTVGVYNSKIRNCLIDNPYSYAANTPTTLNYKAAYANSTAYSLGDVFSSSSWYFQVTVAGTSGVGLPTAPTALGWQTNTQTSNTMSYRPIMSTSAIGILIDNYTYNTIIDSTIVNNLLSSISVVDTATTNAAAASGIYINKSTFSNPISTPLSFATCTDVMISDCTIQGAIFSSGIIMKSTAVIGPNRIVGNLIQNNSMSAINLQGGIDYLISDNIIVQNGTRSANTYPCINVAAAINNFSIINNVLGAAYPTVTGNNSFGITVTSGGSNNYVIVGNRGYGLRANTVNDLGTGTGKVIASNL